MDSFLFLLFGGFLTYSILNKQGTTKEMVYLDFWNNYLLKNNVAEIVIKKDRRHETSAFAYRAEIKMRDD